MGFGLENPGVSRHFRITTTLSCYIFYGQQGYVGAGHRVYYGPTMPDVMAACTRFQQVSIGNAALSQTRFRNK